MFVTNALASISTICLRLQVRARMFNTEVSALQFNVLVTTYEYIMRDRARLSKVSLELSGSGDSGLGFTVSCHVTSATPVAV